MTVEFLRLREALVTRLTSVLHNTQKMRLFKIYDKKTLAVEILKQEEQSTFKKNGVLILIRFWDIKTGEFSHIKEIKISQNGTLIELAKQISN